MDFVHPAPSVDNGLVPFGKSLSWDMFEDPAFVADPEYLDPHEPPPFVYVCFQLVGECLSAQLEGRLTKLGVECLMDGEPGRAYGIVRNASVLARSLQGEREILAVEEGEPRCCK